MGGGHTREEDFLKKPKKLLRKHKLKSFLQKPLTVSAKSSILEIYLTGSPTFSSECEIHFMNIKTKTAYIKLKIHIYISFC